MIRSIRGRTMRPHPVAQLATALAAAASGCVAYQPDPLVPADVLAAIDADRTAAPSEPSATGVGLATAARWLLEDGPAITEARAAYVASRAVAAVDTPWPDPTLLLGPQLGWGNDVDTSKALTPFGQLSMQIPVGGRLTRQNELNRLRAESDRIAVLLTLRDEVLALRAELIGLTAAARRSTLQRELAAATRRARELAGRAIEAGAATALDAGLLELDASRAEAAALDADLVAVRNRHLLAQRTGRAADHFDAAGLGGLPDAPDTLPAVDALRGLMLEHRSEFVRLRLAHEEAERMLRLQVALQYPDLQLQPRYSAEPGEDRNIVGIGIGFQIPLFDRNQVGIARATGARSATRTRFEAACRRALAELDRAHAELTVATERRRQLTDEVAPRAERNVDLARRAIESGRGDILRVLDVQRTWRAVQVQVLEARAAELQAWLRLEAVVGHPLLEFPGDPLTPPTLPPSDDDENPDPVTDAMTPATWNQESDR